MIEKLVLLLCSLMDGEIEKFKVLFGVILSNVTRREVFNGKSKFYVR